VQRAYQLGGHLEGEARLPRTPRPGQGEEARSVREHRDELLELALAPDEGHRDDWEVRGVEGPQRREVASAELEQALRSGQILQPVLAEIAEGDISDEATGRLGEDDLSPVSGAGDSRRAVDVDADVALLGHDRLAGVEAHANADRPGPERVVGLNRRGNGAGGSRERDEERVTLRIYLDACVSRERLPQCSSVLGEEIHVASAVLVEKSCRSLDIGEEERDRATR
jgi:hypothetical protein